MVSIEIDRGMKDGQEIVFFEQGEPLIDGEPGDLKFRVVTVKDAKFPYERRGDDLLMEVEVSLLEALVGFKKKFSHMDGHEVPLESSEITRPGQTRVIKGEGMPVGGHGGKFGDLHVKFSIRVRGVCGKWAPLTRGLRPEEADGGGSGCRVAFSLYHLRCLISLRISGSSALLTDGVPLHPRLPRSFRRS